MLEQTILTTEQTGSWPENYYRETDGKKRGELLEARIGGEDSEENKLRRHLWQKRYCDSKNKVDGIDRYLKMWNQLPYALEQKNSILGKRSFFKIMEEIKLVFQLEEQKSHPEYEKIWYDEYVNFCSFYIQISRTDRTYTSVLFNLGRMTEESLVVKIAGDLCEKTITLPTRLGLREEFALLAKAAQDSFGFYFPEESKLYQELREKCQ